MSTVFFSTSTVEWINLEKRFGLSGAARIRLGYAKGCRYSCGNFWTQLKLKNEVQRIKWIVSKAKNLKKALLCTLRTSLTTPLVPTREGFLKIIFLFALPFEIYLLEGLLLLQHRYVIQFKVTNPNLKRDLLFHSDPYRPA